MLCKPQGVNDVVGGEQNGNFINKGFEAKQVHSLEAYNNNNDIAMIYFKISENT